MDQMSKHEIDGHEINGQNVRAWNWRTWKWKTNLYKLAGHNVAWHEIDMIIILHCNQTIITGIMHLLTNDYAGKRQIQKIWANAYETRETL